MTEKQKPEIQRVLENTEIELRQMSPGLFSPEGFDRLKLRIGEFTEELTTESIRISRRHQSDSVSPAYVDQAAEHLASHSPARWQRVMGGIGSIILGVGLATAGSMIQLGVYSTRGVVLSLICIMFGIPAFMLHFMRE